MSVGPDKPLPVDGRIQISFDRYLLPASITRQSVFVVDANDQPADPVLTTYDPVSRTITIAGSTPTWIMPGQPYKLRFSIPPNEQVVDRGLRAIDGATLDPNQKLEIAFFAEPARGETFEKTIDFCGDIIPLFTLRCTNGQCHGSPQGRSEAAAGLILDSFAGIQNTAFQRVANTSNTSGRSSPETPGRVFGINMPLIAPGQPDNSWLLYKVELARPSTVDAGRLPELVCNRRPNSDETAPRTEDPFRFLVRVEPADDFERALLNDYVPGREMPYPPSRLSSPIEQPLTFEERQRIRMWIAQGAVMTACGGCTDLDAGTDAGTTTDAGSGNDGGDDAASDAGTDAADASDAADQ